MPLWACCFSSSDLIATEAVRRECLVECNRELSQANLQQLFFFIRLKGFTDGWKTRNKEKIMAYNKVEIEFNGQPLTIETGKVARQADGAVIVTYGETKVLCTVVSARKMRAGQDFFPPDCQLRRKILFSR